MIRINSDFLNASSRVEAGKTIAWNESNYSDVWNWEARKEPDVSGKTGLSGEQWRGLSSSGD